MVNKKALLIVVTLVAFIVCLVMINRLINRGERTQDQAAVPAAVAPAAKAAAPVKENRPAAVAEEPDPQTHSGPLLR